MIPNRLLLGALLFGLSTPASGQGIPVIELIDAGGRPVDAYTEGERVHVRLQTSGNPGSVDAFVVTVTAGLTGDQETLWLWETGPETNVFTGSLPTRRAEGSQGDGTLQLGRVAGSPPQLDTVTVTAGASGASDTADFTGSRTRLLDAYGRDAQVYATGSAMHVRVEDHNADHPASQDTLAVSLRSLATGDVETVVLTETARRGGIFEGSLPLADSAGAVPSDGKLQSRPGEEVEARHTDDLGAVSWDRAMIAAAMVEIVGDDGQPAAEVLEDGTVRVRVFSLADAAVPSSPDTLTVLLRTRFAGDEESLTLSETGPDTRVFEGSLSLSTAPAGTGNGILETAGGEQGDDEVTASYGAASDTVSAVTVRLWLVDSAGRNTASYALGEPIRIRAERRRGSNPEVQERISVEARILPDGDEEWGVWLEETGWDTRLFEGVLSTAQGNGPLNDGLLQGQVGRTVEVSVGFPDRPTRFLRQAALGWSALELVDLQGKPAPYYLESSRAQVRVVDHFADPDPASAGTVQVSLSAEVTGHFAIVTLAETGPATGIFTGSASMRLAPLPGSGVLETAESFAPPHFDRITAEYRNPSNVSADAVDLRGSLTWFTDAYGNPAASYATGSTVHVQVEDHNAVQPGQAGPVQVTLRSLATGDEEILELREVGEALFGGSLALQHAGSPSAEDGRLQALPGEEIEATHADILNLTASGARAWIDREAIAFVDEVGAPTSVVLERGEARLRVESVTDNADPAVVESVVATVQSLYGGDLETVTLGETGPDTGIFTALLLLGLSPAVSGNGVLETGRGPLPGGDWDRLTAIFRDAEAVAETRRSKLSWIDAFGIDAESFAVGERAYLRMVSPRSDQRPDSLDTVPVHVRDLADGSYENIQLEETGPSTGVFEGSIGTADEAEVPSSGVLLTSVGATLSVEHHESPDPNASTDLALMTASSVRFLNPQGRPTSSFPKSSRVYVRLVDSYAGTDPGSADSAEVTLAAELTGDEESLSLTETGARTGVFEGSSLLRHGLAQPGDGTLDTGEEVGPPQVDDAIRATRTTSRGTSTASAAVVPVDNPPVAVNDTAQVAEDATVSVPVLANDADPEGSLLSVAGVTQGAHGTVAVDSGQTVTYAPHADYFGSDTFTYTASDGQGGSGTATVSVTVTPVNDPPVAVDDSAEVAENGAVSVMVLANDTDVDGNALAVAGVDQGLHGRTTVQADQTIRYEPDPHYFGSDSFTYTISDGQGGIATATVSVTVTWVNDPPIADNDVINDLDEDSMINVAVLANDTDFDGGSLAVTAVTQADHGTVTIQADQATVRYEPAANYHGSDSFTYTISDGQGGSDTATVSVTVTPVQDPPVAVVDSFQVVEDGAMNMTVLANDADADGDALTVSVMTQATRGTATVQPDQTIRYEPAANYHGPDSFTYTISDGHGGSDVATVSVTVTPVNDPPVAVDNIAQMAEDLTVSVAVLANDADVDGDPLTVAAVTPGAHGTVAIQPDQTVRYEPAANFHGSDSFSYTVADGQGGSDTATVTVNVAPVNDPPVAIDDSAVTLENQAVHVDVLANDSDVDGPGLQVLSVTQPAHGTVYFTNFPGVLGYGPEPGYAGSDKFEYTVSDGAGGKDTAEVNVTVRVPRVWSGIQAFYDFAEGGGDIVHDRSGVGTSLDLTVADPSAVHWGNGSLVFDAATIAESGAAAAKVIDACRASDALTLEVWVTPAILAQSGKWILTLSGGETERNFTLGQGAGLPSGDQFEGRVRATLTTQNGVPSLFSSTVSAQGALVHVVYTRTSTGTARIYVDNQKRGELVVGGTFDGWSSAYRLALGAELGGTRSWLGEIHLAAAYCRALTEDEVRQNFRAGPSGY